jgi:hypothetical protein
LALILAAGWDVLILATATSLAIFKPGETRIGRRRRSTVVTS